MIRPLPHRPPPEPRREVDPAPSGGRWVTSRGILPPPAAADRRSAPLTGRVVCGIRLSGTR